MSETLERAAAAGLSVAPLDTLPRLQDIDTAEVRERFGLGSGFRVLLQRNCAWHP